MKLRVSTCVGTPEGVLETNRLPLHDYTPEQIGVEIGRQLKEALATHDKLQSFVVVIMANTSE